jgi:opacity protein-like surface antigen
MLQFKCPQPWLRKAALCLLMGFAASAATWAQDVGGYYSNRKALGGFVEYSDDSSHMLLGYAEGRTITAVGASFERRSFLRSGVTGSWVAEVRPYMTVTDPTMKGFTLAFPQQPAYSGIVEFSSPVPVDNPVKSTPFNVILVTPNQVYGGTATYIAGTRSTYVSAFSPLGYKLSAFPRRRMQPFVTGLGGFAISPRDIPVFNSSSFNYTFELGAGVEIYQTHSRSCQFEYRYHHLANTESGAANPGIDSGVFKVSYSFGW